MLLVSCFLLRVVCDVVCCLGCVVVWLLYKLAAIYVGCFGMWKVFGM